MADITLEHVLQLAKQLTPEEQQLIRELQGKHPLLNFPLDDLGAWPEGLSLRREDRGSRQRFRRTLSVNTITVR